MRWNRVLLVVMATTVVTEVVALGGFREWISKKLKKRGTKKYSKNFLFRVSDKNVMFLLSLSLSFAVSPSLLLFLPLYVCAFSIIFLHIL